MNCQYCGTDFEPIRPNQKYCSKKCRRDVERRPKSKIRKLIDRAWKRSYRSRNLVHIIYECPHDVPQKHHHHFDYELPYEVILLCPVCHAAEHKRLRDLAKSAQAEAI